MRSNVILQIHSRFINSLAETQTGFTHGTRGLSRECVLRIPSVSRKMRLNGAVSQNNGIKRLAPCRCSDGHIKVYGVGSTTVGSTSSSVRMHIYVHMCRHVYDWNIVDCNVKQPIHLTSPHTKTGFCQHSSYRKEVHNIPKSDVQMHDTCTWWIRHFLHVASKTHVKLKVATLPRRSPYTSLLSNHTGDTTWMCCPRTQSPTRMSKIAKDVVRIVR